MSAEQPIEELLSQYGLFLCPLNNGDWICGGGSYMYALDIMQNHYDDPLLGIGTDARKAIKEAIAKGLGIERRQKG